MKYRGENNNIMQRQQQRHGGGVWRSKLAENEEGGVEEIF